jgi:hypothetical protein
MQTLRDWCDVPAGKLLTTITGPELQATAAAFRAEGRTLWVLAGDPKLVSQVSPSLRPTLIGTATSKRELQTTIGRPTQNYAQSQFSVYGAEVTS